MTEPLPLPETITSVGDMEWHVRPIIDRAVALGSNVFEAINLVRTALDKLAARQYRPASLTAGHKASVDEAMG